MPLVVPGISPASKKAEDKKSDAKATAQHHQANPGPVDVQDKSVFENKPSREEQEARKAELNK